MAPGSRRSLPARAAAAAGALTLLLGLAACGDDTEGDDPTGSGSDGTTETAPADGTTDGGVTNGYDGGPGAACEYPVGGGPVAREVAPPPDVADYTGTLAIALETDRGAIPLELDAASAPCTVNSFASLSEQGYYDDTPCHRLVTSGIFVLQCGDPTGVGNGGPGYTYADELTGAETYPAGTVAMANAGANTNGSQFFLVYEDSPLPPAYTVFGTVGEEGLAVVRDIAAAGGEGGAPDGPPAEPVTIESAVVGEESAPTAPPAEPGSTDGGGETSEAAPEGTCQYPTDPTASGNGPAPEPPPAEPTVEGPVRVNVTSTIGALPLTLDADTAPCAVNSFVSLAEQGYFDGTTCHRLTTSGIEVLQCGDPTGTGTGGPGYSFADELSGEETYPPGTLAMANAGPDTNGSQFFIVYGETPLPPQYVVFGEIGPPGLAAVQRAARAGVRGGGTDGPPKTTVRLTRVTVAGAAGR